LFDNEKENAMEQTSTHRKSTNKKAPVQKASSRKVEATERVGGVRAAGRGTE
jgi:hypothetical protein